MIAPARTPEPMPYRLALTAAETADALGISERTLAAMTAAGEIPHSRIGRRNLRYPVAALQTWLAAQTTMPAGTADGVGVHGPEQEAGIPDDLSEEATSAANSAANRAGRRAR